MLRFDCVVARVVLKPSLVFSNSLAHCDWKYAESNPKVAVSAAVMIPTHRPVVLTKSSRVPPWAEIQWNDHMTATPMRIANTTTTTPDLAAILMSRCRSHDCTACRE